MILLPHLRALSLTQSCCCCCHRCFLAPQALFFTYTGLSTPDGFKWMGVMTIAVTALYMLMHFPMWGGMFTKAREGVTEEDYYLAEWTPEERAQVRTAWLCCCSLYSGRTSQSSMSATTCTDTKQPATWGRHISVVRQLSKDGHVPQTATEFAALCHAALSAICEQRNM